MKTPQLLEENTQPENTRPDHRPWFEDDEPALITPDPERLRTSTAALRIALDRLERRLG
jgi:hypothetical protein